MRSHSPVRRLALLTGGTLGVTVALGLIKAMAEPGVLGNLAGLLGVIGVLAVLGFAWALLDAWRKQGSDSRAG